MSKHREFWVYYDPEQYDAIVSIERRDELVHVIEYAALKESNAIIKSHEKCILKLNNERIGLLSRIKELEKERKLEDQIYDCLQQGIDVRFESSSDATKKRIVLSRYDIRAHFSHSLGDTTFWTAIMSYYVEKFKNDIKEMKI